MAFRSRNRLEAFIDATFQLGQASTPADVEGALPALRNLFQADALVYHWDVFGPKAACGALGHLTAHPTHVADDPQLAYLAELPPGARVIPLTRIVGRRRAQRSEAYLSHYRRAGLDQLLCANFTQRPPASSHHLGIIFGRREPFTKSDEEGLARLLPWLSAFDRRMHRLRRLGLTAASLSRIVELRSAHALLVVSSDAEILWRSDAARRLLDERPGRDCVLPPEVVEAVGGARSGNRAASHAGTLRTLRRRVAFDLQCLDAESDEVLFLVELMPDAERPLTKTERRVMALLEQGTTLKVASQALCVSLETVRTHTRSIYRKYGVASRAELLAVRRL